MDKLADDQLDNSNQQQQQQQQQQQEQQQQPQQHHQQQQHELTNTTTSTTTTTTTNDQPSSATSTSSTSSSSTTSVSTPQSMLFSTSKWGVTPIRQDTPWDLPPSPNQPNSTTSTSNSAAPSNAAAAVVAAAAAAAAASAASSANLQTNSTNNNNTATNNTQLSSTSSSASLFTTNHNLINQAPVSSIQKSMLNSGNGGNGGSSFVSGMQQGDAFARAPGQTLSMMDNNMAPKPFSVASRPSTWSAFGSPASNDPNEPEWPKTTSSGISAGPTGIAAFAAASAAAAAAAAAASGPYLTSAVSKSPTGSQYEPSGIGTWSPIVKGARPGSKWDGDGPGDGRGDNGRFDDGTAIWGSPAQNKVAGLDWVTDKNAELNSNNSDKSRSMAGNNQSYRPQQSSSSTSLLMSSNTSPSNQHSRTQQTLKQPLSSHNFDQVQQQSNALSSQVNQPNRALGLSPNVPSTQQLKHMVQQIQLAVQAGHLNPQILNQPLAPVTLQLLYQLLQQIKVLHQLQLQATQQFNKPENHPAAVNVHITKTKQNILNLQNQIAAQQAVYLKQPQGHNISSRQPTMPSLATGGVGTGIGPALPPGISQSGDSFRSGSSISDFHGPSAMVNNFGVDSMNANGLANSLGHMNLGGGNGSGGSGLHSRFDQQWRAPAAKQQYQSSMAASTPFGNHNLMNQVPSTIQKSMLNSGASGNGGSSFASGGMQQGDGFDRAPGQASSMMDNNMAPKPFGMSNRSSTWSAFGSPASNQPEPEWPKTTTSGISGGNSTQPSNAFDLVPEFEPGKPWRGSILMKSVEDDPTMTPGSMARSLAPQRKTIWSDEI